MKEKLKSYSFWVKIISVLIIIANIITSKFGYSIDSALIFDIATIVATLFVVLGVITEPTGINNKNDYEALFSKNYQELVGKTDAITIINKDKTKLKDLTKCMSIYFNSSLSIDSKSTFKVCSDFKVVNI